jgi:hypothetical protein
MEIWELEMGTGMGDGNLGIENDLGIGNGERG